MKGYRCMNMGRAELSCSGLWRDIVASDYNNYWLKEAPSCSPTIMHGMAIYKDSPIWYEKVGNIGSYCMIKGE